MTAISIVVLVTWFLVTCLSQFHWQPMERLKTNDICALIPNWKLFAPRPGTSDYYLVVRDYGPLEGWGRWREIPLGHSRSPWRFLWNPQKRQVKMLTDVVRDGSQLARHLPLEGLVLSLPYLAILNYVTFIRRPPLCLQTQFMILKTEGTLDKEEPQLVFLSAIHDLHPACSKQTQGMLL